MAGDYSSMKKKVEILNNAITVKNLGRELMPINFFCWIFFFALKMDILQSFGYNTHFLGGYIRLSIPLYFMHMETLRLYKIYYKNKSIWNCPKTPKYPHSSCTLCIEIYSHKKTTYAIKVLFNSHLRNERKKKVEKLRKYLLVRLNMHFWNSISML